MKRISVFAGTVAMLFALVLPGPRAHADYVSLGMLTPVVSVPLFESHSGNGSIFADTFSFSVATDASLSSILGSVQFGDITGITNFTSSLWQAGGASPLATGITTTYDGPFGISLTNSLLSYEPLLAGALSIYEIRTAGTVAGNIGSYAGVMTLKSIPGVTTIRPVPEPATGTILLAGLVLVGFVVQRRQKGAAVG